MVIHMTLTEKMGSIIPRLLHPLQKNKGRKEEGGEPGKTYHMSNIRLTSLKLMSMLHQKPRQMDWSYKALIFTSVWQATAEC